MLRRPRSAAAMLLALRNVNGDSDFAAGNMILHTVYGTPLEGYFKDLDVEFEKRVYGPLGFRLVQPPFASEGWPVGNKMITELGYIARRNTRISM